MSKATWSGIVSFTRLCVLLVFVLPLAGSCNPDLVNTVTGGSQVPLAPGPSVPWVQVLLYNQTQYTTFSEVALMTEDPDWGGFPITFQGISPQIGSVGILLRCPTGRIGLGDLDDPDSLTAGLAVGLSELEIPFSFGQNPLVEGISYECGDTVFIVAVDDNQSPQGVSFGMGVYSGSQQGPVTDIETFQVVHNVLLVEGLIR
jgi:hypothetical protein